MFFRWLLNKIEFTDIICVRSHSSSTSSPKRTQIIPTFCEAFCVLSARASSIIYTHTVNAHDIGSTSRAQFSLGNCLDTSDFHVGDSENESVIHQVLFVLFRFVEIRVRDEFCITPTFSSVTLSHSLEPFITFI